MLEKNNEEYLETDTILEAINSLEVFVLFLKKIPKDNHYWKWAIISLHNSFQNFMVHALRGTNNFPILDKKSGKKMLNYYQYNNRNKNLKRPNEKLDYFPKLYNKIKSNIMIQYINSKKLKSTKEIDDDIKRLNNLRNDFIHFIPKLWALEISGLPRIFSNTLFIINFLVKKSGNINFYLSSGDNHKILEEKFNNLFSEAQKLIKTKNFKKQHA